MRGGSKSAKRVMSPQAELAASFKLEVTAYPEKDRHFKVTVFPRDPTEGISKILLPQMQLSVQEQQQQQQEEQQQQSKRYPARNRAAKKQLIGPDNMTALMAKVLISFFRILGSRLSFTSSEFYD